MATPAPVSSSVMQMVAGSSQHRSHRFCVSSEELEKMEAEINHEQQIAEEEDDNEEEKEEEEESTNEKGKVHWLESK